MFHIFLQKRQEFYRTGWKKENTIIERSNLPIGDVIENVCMCVRASVFIFVSEDSAYPAYSVLRAAL